LGDGELNRAVFGFIAPTKLKEIFINYSLKKLNHFLTIKLHK
jgi:hypothetical protein